jgi:eukaryotic-like serine/threonine-protein kinase
MKPDSPNEGLDRRAQPVRAARVEQLLEELLDSGGTPEEACQTCPELLPEVVVGWQRLRALQAELGALFPQSPGADSAWPTWMPSADLPQIPGYDVQELLGRGGTGVVYKAWHQRLGRAVALKMLLAGRLARPTEQERLLREAAAVASLRHPNIVQIYDMGDLDGQRYFTMEYIEGGSLAQKLAGAPQPADQAAALVATLAKAIQVAHQSGIIHRDLKPGNVLLTADGTPKVSDFGLARRLDSDSELTVTGVPVGTPSYMAPEQGLGQRNLIGPATDVYALGAILYELLTGRPPFRAETAATTLQQLLTEEPVPPTRLNRRVPRDLETICLKCLHKEPSRRYGSAAALAEDLQRFARCEPIAARPAGLLERMVRRARRHPAAAGLLAALAALAVTAGVGALLVYQQQVDSHIRQARTDGEVRGVLERTRGLLEEGWQAHDLAKLTEARAEAQRAVDIGRSGEASAAVQQQAEALQRDAVGRLGRATKNNALLDALLDVSAPRKTSGFVYEEAGVLLAPPSLDEQYAAAFRQWGLDFDIMAEAEVVERLRQQPDVVLQGLVPALDAWMLEGRLQKQPEAQWRRLFRVAEQLDVSKQHRRLRAWLVGAVPPRAEIAASMVATGSPWPALWELAPGNAWRGLQEFREQIQPQTDPVLTVLLLARALAKVGDMAGAEKVLRQAAAARPNQVVLLDTLGKLLLGQGPSRLEAAIGYYRAARSLRPQLGIALSRALRNAGNLTESTEVLQDLVRRQPDNPSFYVFLAMAVYEHKKVDEAQTLFRKALDLNPNMAHAHYGLGIILDGQKKHREAEAAYRKAIDLKPDFMQAYYNLGNTLRKQGKHAEAERASQKAVDCKPNFAPAFNNLSLALMSQGKLVEAEKAIRKAIDLQPTYSGAYSNLGLVLQEQGKDGEAEAACRKAIDLNSNLAEAHNNLGAVLFRHGQTAEAEAAFRKAIDLQPDLASAHVNLGASLTRRQKYGEAEAALGRAIDLNPDFAEAFYNLGIALNRQKKFVAAERAFQRAIDLRYENAEAFNDLGMALGQQSKHVQAEAAFRKAIDLQPNLLSAYVNLGTALMGRKKSVEAESTLRKAIGLQSDFGPAHYFLGKVLMQQARFDEASAVLKKAAELLRPEDSHRKQASQLVPECQHWMLLDSRLPGVLTGKEKPANEAERLQFAQLCFLKTHHVAAARFCREAFAAEPKLADDVASASRYVAACAAALAGSGQGKDGDHLDERDRMGWRQQAHDWLRQELDSYGQALGSGKAQANAWVQQRLRNWQADVSLDCVRAQDALARLPKEERMLWQRLWSDVAALLQQVTGKD